MSTPGVEGNEGPGVLGPELDTGTLGRGVHGSRVTGVLGTGVLGAVGELLLLFFPSVGWRLSQNHKINRNT